MNIDLSKILPGDTVIDTMDDEGFVVDLDEIRHLPFYSQAKSTSHLQGGKFIWVRWPTLDNRILNISVDELKEHFPQGSQYDPEQQPYTEGDI